MSRKTIEQVQREYSDEWMAISGVEGTAIGRLKGMPCIKVFVSAAPEEIRKRIPAIVEGHRVVIEETGTFRPPESQ